MLNGDARSLENRLTEHHLWVLFDVLAPIQHLSLLRRFTGIRVLFHDKQIIKPPQKKVSLIRRLAVVAHLQRLVVAHHRNDIHRLKAFLQEREEFKSDREESLAVDV